MNTASASTRSAPTAWSTAALKAPQRPTHCAARGNSSRLGMTGVNTDKPMAADIDLSQARKAEDVHEAEVGKQMERIKVEDPEGFRRASRAAA